MSDGEIDEKLYSCGFLEEYLGIFKVPKDSKGYVN
jgi:hypothetical protein